MAWLLVEELSELDPATVEAQYGLRRVLERVREKLARGARGFAEEVEVLEEATSPATNYPCKIYFELLAAELRRLEAGLPPRIDPLELVEEALVRWPDCRG